MIKNDSASFRLVLNDSIGINEFKRCKRMAKVFGCFIKVLLRLFLSNFFTRIVDKDPRACKPITKYILMVRIIETNFSVPFNVISFYSCRQFISSILFALSVCASESATNGSTTNFQLNAVL